MNPPLNYLVLGHKGFLGSLIKNKLELKDAEVRVIEERITPDNIQECFSLKIDENTRVVNCIASGVTPNTGGDLADDFANHSLLKLILEFFIDSKGHDLVHFASNYETVNRDYTVSSRSSYINSKQQGSLLCRTFLTRDSRIQLVYLPTVLASTQPKGRFLSDFSDAHSHDESFRILYPEMLIELVSFDELWMFLEFLFEEKTATQIHFAPIEISVSVYVFAKLLNDILEELNLPAVKLTLESGINIDRRIDLDNIPFKFRRTLLNYLQEMVEN
jgi:hypothetical protein